jgi:hypothetical protein
MFVLAKGDRTIQADLDVSVSTPSTFSVILGSSGDGVSRNPEYASALTEILRRAATVARTLDDCLVVSDQSLKNYPDEDARRIPLANDYRYPVPLTGGVDFDALRHAITTPQRRVASKAKTGGNQRKKIELRFSAITASVTRQEVLAALDAVPAKATRKDRKDIATGLTAADVHKSIDEWNEIGAEAFHAKYGTKRAARYVIATPDGGEYDAKAILFGARRSKGMDGENTDFDGDRQTVALPLEGMGFLVEDLRQKLGEENIERFDDLEPAQVVAQARAFLGATDGVAERRFRREQRLLRKALGLGNGSHCCYLCGREFPDQLLVAAHIKKRSACDDHEKVDIPAVAMITCALGCDALFEQGFVVVDGNGVVVAAKSDSNDEVRALTRRLEGRVIGGWSHASAKYFEWHRCHHTSTAPRQ